ncbi:MAG TPA: hypothetical protein VIE37_06865 [Methylomirabilota bacterium]|jgi:hypothetical protein
MRTPIRPIPHAVERWASRVRYLRWLDMLIAWLVLWASLALALPLPLPAQGVLAATAVGLLACLPPLRLRWRPVSGAIGVRLSRGLRPGDRAWYVVPGRAEAVIVTARRGLRLVVARPDLGPAEGIEVRRTRVLVLRP